MDAPYELLDQVEPGIGRLLAHNPSAFTYYGTQTYLAGESEVAVIDPGPDDPTHVDAIIEAVGARELAAIVCTHTHRDHSPAAASLAQRTGAPIVGCAALALETVGPRADAAFDGDYSPDRILKDGEAIEVDGGQLVAVATPGHTSNHLCFALPEVGALFSGDHVMGWSTTVVAPPDGDMAAYMASLARLRARTDSVYYPAHGPAVTDPRQHLDRLVAHRRNRERQILAHLAAGEGRIPAMVADMYRDVDPRLHPAAGRSVLAHLIDLEARGLVRRDGDVWSPTS